MTRPFTKGQLKRLLHFLLGVDWDGNVSPDAGFLSRTAALYVDFQVRETRPHNLSPLMSSLHARFSLTHEAINRTLATIERLVKQIKDKPLSIVEIGRCAFKVEGYVVHVNGAEHNGRPQLNTCGVAVLCQCVYAMTKSALCKHVVFALEHIIKTTHCTHADAVALLPQNAFSVYETIDVGVVERKRDESQNEMAALLFGEALAAPASPPPIATPASAATQQYCVQIRVLPDPRDEAQELGEREQELGEARERREAQRTLARQTAKTRAAVAQAMTVIDLVTLPGAGGALLGRYQSAAAQILVDDLLELAVDFARKVTGAWINFKSRSPGLLPVVEQPAGPSKTIADTRKRAVETLRKSAKAQRKKQQKSRTKRPRGATQSAMRRRDVVAHDAAVVKAGEEVLPGTLRKRARESEAAQPAESDDAPMAEAAAGQRAAKKSKTLASDDDE